MLADEIFRPARTNDSQRVGRGVGVSDELLCVAERNWAIGGVNKSSFRPKSLIKTIGGAIGA